MMLPRQTAAKLVDRQKASCEAKQYVTYMYILFVYVLVSVVVCVSEFEEICKLHVSLKIMD